MGAWGMGPFDNDDAADWAFEFEDAEDSVELLLSTLNAVDQGGDATDASRAVAAVAWMLSGRHGEATLGALPEQPAPALTPSLRAAAVRAVGYVLAVDSEWRELWEEADDDEPIRQLEGYRAHLLLEGDALDAQS